MRMIIRFLSTAAIVSKLMSGKSASYRNISEKEWSEEEKRHHKFERMISAFNAVISLLAAIATGAAAIFAYNAYFEAKRQANVAQRALEISLRPWVYVESLELPAPLVITSEEIVLTVQARVKNYSQIPANSIMLSAQAFLHGAGETDLIAATKTYCRAFRYQNFNFGEILPTGEIQKTNLVGANAKIPDFARYKDNRVDDANIKLSIATCLNYNGPDGAVHQIMTLHQIIDVDSFDIRVRPGTIPKERLRTYLLFMYAGDRVSD